MSCYFHPLSLDPASLEAADASEKERGFFSSQFKGSIYFLQKEMREHAGLQLSAFLFTICPAFCCYTAPGTAMP